MKARRLIGLMFVAVLATVTISCGVDQATAPATESLQASQNILRVSGGKLLSCAVTAPGVSSLRIGQQGGTIKVGKHKLVIPAGALSKPTTITMEMFGAGINSVELSPHGLTFAAGKPAVLTLNYDNCSPLAPGQTRKVAYTTSGLQILEILPSVDETSTKKVTTHLQHFSRYAVAW